MKFGVRTPSLKRRISARTSPKRYVRHTLGVKAPRGMGLVTNPKKAVYNKIYNRTTVSVDKLLKSGNRPIRTNERAHAPYSKPSANISAETGSIIRSSSSALRVTSKNFAELRKQLTTVYDRRVLVRNELREARSRLSLLNFAVIVSYVLMFGLFYRGISEAKARQANRVSKLEYTLAETYVTLTFADKSQFEKSWLNCSDTFQELMNSQRIWDITYEQAVNRAQARTIASTVIQRTALRPINGSLEFIKCDLDCLTLPNANGLNIYIYPTFLVLFKDYQQFGIFDLREIKARLQLTQFVEAEGVPSDSEIIKYTWKKANKDGSRDKRFNGNYQIPVVKYGEMQLESDTGLQEYYQFSNFAAFIEFAKTFATYVGLLEKQQ